jgi:hypothetical protein
MKWLSAIASFGLALTLTVSSSGCKKGEKGEAKAGGETKYTVEGPAPTSIDPGKSTEVTVKISRKGDFKDEVKVSLADLPEKVTATPKEPTIGKDNTSATIKLEAANDAPAVKDHAINITTSGGGATEKISFKLTVNKKEKEKGKG